ncbi:glycosyltransferase [Aciduricibacillus chroicocephali]|uniref:Glycosyltransferase n=1 Tax=Aciduricibacillus chroicocephali TaxID=3054939 RepID=A0ABY9KX84_9BACI|nr:glycosyltransferase [Bacillaceae bacterium 44XB]
MKVALLTMFNGLDSTYSIVNVVAEQLKMMLDDEDVTPIMLVTENCSLNERYGVFLDERIEWRKVANSVNDKQIHWHDYTEAKGEVHDTFFNEAETVAADLTEKLKDVDVCVMHDIHYQGWHLLHNIAVRMAQKKLPQLPFIAFTHSAPVSRPKETAWPFSARFSPMPNTTYVYPTQSGISALAEQYDTPEGTCRAVNNSLDLLSNASEAVLALAEKVNLFTPDILVIYPGRLTTGKRFEKVASLCGAIKKHYEKTVQIIYCDFPSADIESDRYKTFIRHTGKEHGLENEDIFFTSDLDSYKYGFPRESVLELFQLSNLFICPSFSESFGLTVLEAAGRGNIIVLNERVPALEELGKKLHAHFMCWDARNFGFDTFEDYHPSEEAYLKDHAGIIVNLMKENPVIHAKTIARQRYTPQWIWHHQLKPLLKKE